MDSQESLGVVFLLAGKAYGLEHLLKDRLIGIPVAFGRDKHDEPESFGPERRDDPIELVRSCFGRLAQSRYGISRLPVETEILSRTGDEMQVRIASLQLTNQLVGGGGEARLSPALRRGGEITGHGAIGNDGQRSAVARKNSPLGDDGQSPRILPVDLPVAGVGNLEEVAVQHSKILRCRGRLLVLVRRA